MQIALVAAGRVSEGEKLRGLRAAACHLHAHVPPVKPVTCRRRRRTPRACRRCASAPGSALNKSAPRATRHTHSHLLRLATLWLLCVSLALGKLWAPARHLVAGDVGRARLHVPPICARAFSAALLLPLCARTSLAPAAASCHGRGGRPPLRGARVGRRFDPVPLLPRLWAAYACTHARGT